MAERVLVMLLMLGLLGGVSGCSLLPTAGAAPDDTPAPEQLVLPDGPGAVQGDGRWHSCRIGMQRDDDGSARWALDAFLARQVYAPALAAHRSEIRFWRFHRRAANDSAGHRFSFIFYASSQTGDALYPRVLEAHGLRQLQAAGLITYSQCDADGGWQGQSVADSSDPSWAPEIQRAWPAFIMGTSEFWLRLLDEVLEPAGEPESLEDSIARYERANERLTTLWVEQGQHALLHHLSAVFGYRPMLIRY